MVLATQIIFAIRQNKNSDTALWESHNVWEVITSINYDEWLRNRCHS